MDDAEQVKMGAKWMDACIHGYLDRGIGEQMDSR